MLSFETLRLRRRNLPHWEIRDGRYFITVRQAGTLPESAQLKLREVRQALQAIPPQSSEFSALQRRHFAITESYSDTSPGLLNVAPCAQAVVQEFAALQEWHVQVPHYTIMPNHWHALLVPPRDCERSLSDVIRRIKGRTARAIRNAVGGEGPVWQRECFDHWIRNETEWEHCVCYIRHNPVKAGIVARWEDHPWTR